ncbi:MAG: hypothetical protein R3F60_01975 [bacterium]
MGGSERTADDLRRAWRTELGRAGLQVGPGPAFTITHSIRLARIEARCVAGADPTFEITATHPGLPADVRIRREVDRGLLARTLGLGDVRTFDVAFDDLAELQGDPGFLLAVLGPTTRERLTDALNAGLRVEAGQVTGQVRCDRAAVLVAWVRLAGDLATRLSLHADRVPVTLIRLADRAVEPRLQAAALAALKTWLMADTPHWADIRRLLRGPRRTTLGLDLAAYALGRHPAGAVELRADDLIALLPRVDAPARAAIATRLGTIGAANALPALRQLANAFFERGAVKAAAQAAMEQILGRTDATVGGLAVVDPHAGLSLADEDLPDDEE